MVEGQHFPLPHACTMCYEDDSKKNLNCQNEHLCDSHKSRKNPTAMEFACAKKVYAHYINGVLGVTFRALEITRNSELQCRTLVGSSSAHHHKR